MYHHFCTSLWHYQGYSAVIPISNHANKNMIVATIYYVNICVSMYVCGIIGDQIITNQQLQHQQSDKLHYTIPLQMLNLAVTF